MLIRREGLGPGQKIKWPKNKNLKAIHYYCCFLTKCQVQFVQFFAQKQLLFCEMRDRPTNTRGLSLEDEYKVVKAINSGKKQAEVAQLFDPPLSQSTVATIVGSKKVIISAYTGGMYKDKRKRMKQPSYPDVEKAVAEWLKKVRNINVPVNGPLLAEKAWYFAEQLGYDNFKASNGFLDRFKERQGTTGQNVCGEEKSVDSSVEDTWVERLPDICRSYGPRDRFNADETGLLWKATPRQTLHFKGQKCSGGRTVNSVLLFL